MSQPRPCGCSQAPPRRLSGPDHPARLPAGRQFHLGHASVGMGFLNILEGPHSFAPELQRQGGRAPLLPSSSPPRPAKPRALGSQGWEISQNAGSRGSEGGAVSAAVLRAAGALWDPQARSTDCPELLLPNQETLLQGTQLLQVTQRRKAHKAVTVTLWPRDRQGGSLTIIINIILEV